METSTSPWPGGWSWAGFRGALLGSWAVALARTRWGEGAEDWVRTGLGVALVLSGMATLVLLKARVPGGREPRRLRWAPLVGLAVGFLVGFASVGSGALMTPFLLFFFGLPAPTAVGTGLLQAVPVLVAGGVAHTVGGNVSWDLVAALLLGSLPGVWLGSRVSLTLPEPVVRGVLGVALVGVGVRMW